MPRFFIDTFDGIDAIDEVGQDLPDVGAVKALVQRSLVAMVAEEADQRSSAQIYAVVRNADGERILTATMAIAVEWSDEESVAAYA